MESPEGFLHGLLAALREREVDVEGLRLDHVCYRVATCRRYRELCAELGTEATLLGEHAVGGRPIAVWLMHRPWTVGSLSIDVLELPAPKAGSPYPEGFEHAEFVVGQDLAAFVARHPNAGWDLSGLMKQANADIRLRLGNGCAKFHRQALRDVIAMEHKSPQA